MSEQSTFLFSVSKDPDKTTITCSRSMPEKDVVGLLKLEGVLIATDAEYGIYPLIGDLRVDYFSKSDYVIYEWFPKGDGKS